MIRLRRRRCPLSSRREKRVIIRWRMLIDFNLISRNYLFFKLFSTKDMDRPNI
jgi:hypothetical protein